MKLLKTLRTDRRGSTVLDFAMLAPALVMFVFGTIELGRLGLASYSVRDAVVTSSRMYRLHPIPADTAVAAAVKERFAKSASDIVTEPVITPSTDVIGTQTINKKTIAFTVNHKLIIPFMSGTAVPLSYQTTIITH